MTTGKDQRRCRAVIDQVVAYITATTTRTSGRRRPGRGCDRSARLCPGCQGEIRSRGGGQSDWQNAMLWASQWWQYQVKTADLGLRAGTFLERTGEKDQSDLTSPETRNPGGLRPGSR